MLVEQLIAELQKYDPKLQVISRGYEGGYVDVDHVNCTKIALNFHEAWYYGPHELASEYGEGTTTRYAIVDAVYVG